MNKFINECIKYFKEINKLEVEFEFLNDVTNFIQIIQVYFLN